MPWPAGPRWATAWTCAAACSIYSANSNAADRQPFPELISEVRARTFLFAVAYARRLYFLDDFQSLFYPTLSMPFTPPLAVAEVEAAFKGRFENISLIKSGGEGA